MATFIPVDFSKSSNKILTEVLSGSNPAFKTATEGLSDPSTIIDWSTLTSTPTDSDGRNASIVATAKTGSGFTGNVTLTYRKVDLAELLPSWNESYIVSGYTGSRLMNWNVTIGGATTSGDLVGLINSTYGINLTSEDVDTTIALPTFTGTTPNETAEFTLSVLASSKIYSGSLIVTLVRDAIPLTDALPVTTLRGMVYGVTNTTSDFTLTNWASYNTNTIQQVNNGGVTMLSKTTDNHLVISTTTVDEVRRAVLPEFGSRANFGIGFDLYVRKSSLLSDALCCGGGVAYRTDGFTDSTVPAYELRIMQDATEAKRIQMYRHGTLAASWNFTNISFVEGTKLTCNLNVYGNRHRLSMISSVDDNEVDQFDWIDTADDGLAVTDAGNIALIAVNGPPEYGSIAISDPWLVEDGYRTTLINTPAASRTVVTPSTTAINVTNVTTYNLHVVSAGSNACYEYHTTAKKVASFSADYAIKPYNSATSKTGFVFRSTDGATVPFYEARITLTTTMSGIGAASTLTGVTGATVEILKNGVVVNTNTLSNPAMTFTSSSAGNAIAVNVTATGNIIAITVGGITMTMYTAPAEDVVAGGFAISNWAIPLTAFKGDLTIREMIVN